MPSIFSDSSSSTSINSSGLSSAPYLRPLMKKVGVESTPTYFINGRKYDAELSHEELIDVLEEEYEKIEGVRYRQ